MSALLWWAVCLLVVGGPELGHASWGDTSHEYRECKEYCLKKNCSTEKDLELWTQRQPLQEYLIGKKEYCLKKN